MNAGKSSVYIHQHQQQSVCVWSGLFFFVCGTINAPPAQNAQHICDIIYDTLLQLKNMSLLAKWHNPHTPDDANEIILSRIYIILSVCKRIAISNVIVFGFYCRFECGFFPFCLAILLCSIDADVYLLEPWKRVERRKKNWHQQYKQIWSR